MENRYACHPDDVKGYDTSRLRREFLVDNLMNPGEINFTYSHYDRFIIGGAVPTDSISLGTYDELKSDYFLERREMGIINVGGAGSIVVDGTSYDIAHKECLFIGKGSKEVVFKSASSSEPAMFYICSCPSHQEFPVAKCTLDEAEPMTLGTKESSNERTIYKFIHDNGIQSSQLVMGMTMLASGCVWNTMPSHVHDRRMEAYFYFDLGSAQVMHFMGQPQESRHIVMQNNQAVLSPPWSMHFGAGTSNYTFIWAMAGENKDYTDMDAVSPEDLK